MPILQMQTNDKELH